MISKISISNLLKIDKKHYKEINIYYTGYITIKKIDDYEIIYNVNPLYLQVNYANGYIEEKNGNKYLIFDDSVDENKEVLKNYNEVWDGIKNKMKAINDAKKMIMKKITWKLNLILRMTCHYTNH